MKRHKKKGKLKNEYLIRYQNNPLTTSACRITRRILIRNQTQRKLIGIVLDNNEKIAPSIARYIQSQTNCAYFRVGQSYATGHLIREMYCEITSNEPSVFRMAFEQAQDMIAYMRKKRIRIEFVIDNVQEFKILNLFNLLKCVIEMNEYCGFIIIFGSENISNLKAGHPKNPQAGEELCSAFDEWHYL